MEYDAYYCDEAKELDKWAHEEVNCLKASRIYKVAKTLEERYRKHHSSKVNDPYRMPAISPPRPPTV